MRRIIIAAIITVCSCLSAKAQQWSVGTNAVDWLNFGTMNIEASVAVAQHISVNASARYNPWTFNAKDPATQLQNREQTYRAGIRYWPWHVYSGWWIGTSAQYQEYNRGGILSRETEEGDAFGLSVSAGYTLMIHKFVNLEFGAGIWSGQKAYTTFACPSCGRMYTLTTKRKQIFCEHCGYLTELNDRYQFTDDFRFRNLAQWYDWQKELLKKEIAQNESYTLSSKVELRLPGDGKSLTRHGGWGECSLSREGLTYSGTKDGEAVTLHFPLRRIYRLLFGAGEDFEMYDGAQILYFVPEEKRSAVQWYMASMLLHDE
jgi:predicted RNA-binding Zn-ribbon protein involved in translation (DUF1610 family)